MPLRNLNNKHRWWNDECAKDTELRNSLKMEALRTKRDEDIQQNQKSKSYGKKKTENDNKNEKSRRSRSYYKRWEMKTFIEK